MKKRICIILLFCAWAAVQAQNDTIPPTYEEDSVVYSAPRRNPIYYFGSPFSEHFLEAKLLAGTADVGVGLDYIYLPEVWGWNVGSYVGVANLWLNAGAAYRLSKPWSKADWQLYAKGGIRCADGTFEQVRPTAEVGVRVAAADGWGSFSATSGSVGILTDFEGYYFTFGLGLTMSTLLSMFLFLL